MIAELQSLKIKTSGEIEVSDDLRGNTTRLFTQKTITTIPVQFGLKLPILSDGPIRTFSVDINFDVQGGNIDIYLESIPLIQMLETDINDKLNEQIQKFENSGIVMLRK